MRRGLLIRLAWGTLVWAITISLLWILHEVYSNAIYLVLAAITLQSLMMVVLPGFEQKVVRLTESDDTRGVSSDKPGTYKRRAELDALGFTQVKTVKGINALVPSNGDQR